MAKYPGAVWKPVAWANRSAQARGRSANVLIFHVAVSETKSLRAFFERSINSSPVCSHFYVRRDGTVEQYIDTKYRSAADREGGARAISVETQGGVKNPDGEKWTTAQVEALAELAKWANKVHKIPLKATKDSRPSTAGISWHRRGIKGNYGAEGNKYAYVAGEVWSGPGKLCPGLAKIKQIPAIIDAANDTSGGAPVAYISGYKTAKNSKAPQVVEAGRTFLHLRDNGDLSITRTIKNRKLITGMVLVTGAVHLTGTPGTKFTFGAVRGTYSKADGWNESAFLESIRGEIDETGQAKLSLTISNKLAKGQRLRFYIHPDKESAPITVGRFSWKGFQW